VLQFWAYLISAVFLFSAELCARLNEWFQNNNEARRAERYAELFDEGQRRRASSRLPKAG